MAFFRTVFSKQTWSKQQWLSIESSPTVMRSVGVPLLSALAGASVITLSVSLALVGCSANNNFAVSTNALTEVSASPTATSSVNPLGPKAVKIIFLNASGGSFDSPSTGGTAASVGTGLQARRVFNADGTLLASGGTNSADWPDWLSSFEIGISGTNNLSSPNTNCANFASNTESTALTCNFGGTDRTPCGAAPNQFRVSEVDCFAGAPPASNGNGGPSDGIYIRAGFDRSQLGSKENILAVLEYAAATLNPAPANPTACLTGGAFSAEACNDFVWRAYLKHSASEVVQPYLMLIPPTFYSVLSEAGKNNAGFSGAGVSAKQIFLPIAADPNITHFQISRTQANFPSATDLKSYCTATGSLPGNSPLCAGVVFYSLTFYRM